MKKFWTKEFWDIFQEAKRRYFEKIKKDSSLYQFSFLYAERQYAKRVEQVNKIYNKLLANFDFKNKKVLDVGCGIGPYIDLLKSKGAKIFAIDIIREIKSLKGKAEIFLSLGECLPFKDKSFDFVICANVLHLSLNPKAMISELHRVLKDDGFALFESPEGDSEDLKYFFKILLEVTVEKAECLEDLKKILSDFEKFLNMTQARGIDFTIDDVWFKKLIEDFFFVTDAMTYKVSTHEEVVKFLVKLCKKL